MSMRLKIAQWLAPELVCEAERLDGLIDRMTYKLHCHRRALREISSLRTPSCASIGKRMADIAETALREDE